MKQIALLGLGYFGKSILDELLNLNVEVFIIDRDKETIDAYKDKSPNSVVIDILNVENLRKILPETIESVIIDMGDSIEASILATSYCAKLKIKTIIVKAESENLGEILTLVGATKVVFPNREAAKRVTPLLFSSTMLNYMPVSQTLSIAELKIPDYLIGKSLESAMLLEKNRLNLVSIRDLDGEFVFCPIDYVFKKDDVGLFSGSDVDLNNFSAINPKEHKLEKVAARFLNFFKRKKDKSAAPDQTAQPEPQSAPISSADTPPPDNAPPASSAPQEAASSIPSAHNTDSSVSAAQSAPPDTALSEDASSASDKSEETKTEVKKGLGGFFHHKKE